MSGEGNITGLCETTECSILAIVELAVVTLTPVITSTHTQLAQIEWSLPGWIKGVILDSWNASLTYQLA